MLLHAREFTVLVHARRRGRAQACQPTIVYRSTRIAAQLRKRTGQKDERDHAYTVPVRRDKRQPRAAFESSLRSQ